MTTQILHVVGHAVPRVDGADKVTGGARYTSDVQLPGLVSAKVLRSPYPHARIVRIDTSAAKQLPGVHAVLTGEDLPPGTRYGRLIFDVQVLAQGVVRFVGDPVAAVAADDEEIAQQALDLIEVEYEELPAVTDPIESSKPGAPILHPEMASYVGYPQPPEQPSNVYHTHVWDKGDVEAGFKDAEVVVENTFTVPVQHHGYMEPHCCTVKIDDDGHVNVWAPNKAPYNAKRQIAACIGV
ncbi:MAG: molybdopterin cofactor-binding domain-containing protein, partial [Dehalococcoidia bacterium]